MSAKVECTWGDGPDVLITVDNSKTNYPIVEHINTNFASFGITANEAIDLAMGLRAAAERCIELENGLRDLNFEK